MGQLVCPGSYGTVGVSLQLWDSWCVLTAMGQLACPGSSVNYRY
jgi:hypothetical protein